MTSQWPSFITTVITGVAMLFLGMRSKLLSLPQVRVRCGACRRLICRGQTCPCTRIRRD
jgi:hypothetical protein